TASAELKTKPTQHSVKALLENGLQPDVLVLRSEHHLPQEVRRKVALFCNVDPQAVVESMDVPTIYEVPLKMREQNLDLVLLEKLNLPADKPSDMKAWEAFVDKVKNPSKRVDIALVGKYVELPDAYKSIIESFVHAGAMNDCKVKLHLIAAEKVTPDTVQELLGSMSGIMVAPGSGARGIDGKLTAVKYARENNVPFFGICLGMQCAVIEFARNVLGYENANSTEMEPTQCPVIDVMEAQKDMADGSTMRRGAYPCHLDPHSKVCRAYNATTIEERHHHRYEFNNDYLDEFEAAGMRAVGMNPETGLVEVMELDNHPWFVATQYHPEYSSNVLNPHPLFVAFVGASLANQK
ncbi:MAG: CTP synthase, partial [Rikenellaceae bacterium]|nr:CTP synthase [Rikenellaceae bacterium]